MDLTEPLRVRGYARQYPLLAMLALVALLLPSLGEQLRPAAPPKQLPSNVMSADGWELSTVPGTRSVGKSDTERNRAWHHLPDLLVLVTVAFASAPRGEGSASSRKTRRHDRGPSRRMLPAVPR